MDHTSFDITMWCLTILVGFGRRGPLDVAAKGPGAGQPDRYQEPASALTSPMRRVWRFVALGSLALELADEPSDTKPRRVKRGFRPW